MKTLRWLSVFTLLLLSLSAPQVWGQSPQGEPTEEDIEKAKALFEEGEIFFQTGEFAKARDKYKESYFLSKRPLLLKNMALCEWNMKNYEEARHLYEAYLHTEPDTARHPQVQEYIEELDALIEQAKTQPALPTLPATVASSLPPPPPSRKFKVWYLALPAALLGGVALTVALTSGGGELEVFPSVDSGFNPIGF